VGKGKGEGKIPRYPAGRGPTKRRSKPTWARDLVAIGSAAAKRHHRRGPSRRQARHSLLQLWRLVPMPRAAHGIHDNANDKASEHQTFPTWLSISRQEDGHVPQKRQGSEAGATVFLSFLIDVASRRGAK